MEDYLAAKAAARSVLISRLVSEVSRELHRETGVPINLAEAQEPWVQKLFSIWLTNNPEYPGLDTRSRWRQFVDWLEACPLRPRQPGI